MMVMRRWIPPEWLYTRPTVLNWLHIGGIFVPHTQTHDVELACLARHAKGRRLALEIGTYMGVSACAIAASMAPDGRLFCVDPWVPRRGRENPCLTICRRELTRKGLLDRVEFVRAESRRANEILPGAFDFAFIDGDHSLDGIKTDWEIVRHRLALGGIVCLHDSLVPLAEPWRRPPSVEYFAEVISRAQDFKMIDSCETLAVLKRVGSGT